jgi:hypothetical protein
MAKLFEKGKALESQKVTGRCMVLPAINEDEFERGFRDAEGKMRNIEIPTFNGLTFENDGRGRNVATTLVNFEAMSNLGDSNHTGSTPEGKPITVARKEVQEGNKVVGKYVLHVDPSALAAASYDERVKAAADKKDMPAPNENTKDRLNLKYSFSNTDKGVAGMNAVSFQANVAKAAAQRYILTASPKDPNKNVPKQDMIEDIADKFVNTYSAFAKEAVKNGSNGIQVKDKEGNIVEGQTVPNTEFPPLKDMGITAVDVNGTTVLGVAGTPGKDQTSAINKALVNFNRAFNAKMSQEINGYAATLDEAKAAEYRQLGNMIGVDSYAVVPRDPKTNEKADVIVIQPATTAVIQPFSGAVLKAFDAAQHQGANDQAKSVEELYGKDIIRNAAEIIKKNEVPSLAGKETDKEKAAAVAKETVAKQLEDVTKALEEAQTPSVEVSGPEQG